MLRLNTDKGDGDTTRIMPYQPTCTPALPMANGQGFMPPAFGKTMARPFVPR